MVHSLTPRDTIMILFVRLLVIVTVIKHHVWYSDSRDDNNGGNCVVTTQWIRDIEFVESGGWDDIGIEP